MNIDEMQTAAGRVAEFLAALASPHRLLVLCQLVEGEKSVGELKRAIGIRQATLSQQLARLRGEGLVATRRSAQTIYYRLARPEVEQTLALMHALFCEDPNPAEETSKETAGDGERSGPETTET